MGESDVKMYPEIFITPVFDERMPEEIRNIEVFRVLRESLWFVQHNVLPSLSKFL